MKKLEQTRKIYNKARNDNKKEIAQLQENS